jgi:hypothetical protein
MPKHMARGEKGIDCAMALLPACNADAVLVLAGLLVN